MSPNFEHRYGLLLLAVDTCGPSGSVALGRRTEAGLELLAQVELEGRTYSATVVSAVRDVLQTAGTGLGDLAGIVAVNGPGSFTGVRVGLSAVKGLAEAARIPVVALSRLLVLSRKAGVSSAALDAHRGELYLRREWSGHDPVELLAGPQELAAVDPVPLKIAVCEETVAGMLAAAWSDAQQIRISAPSAADALEMGAAYLAAGTVADLALLDGHYLRRSDAEIFGEPAPEPRRP